MPLNPKNKFLKLFALAALSLSPFAQADDLTGSNLPSDPFIRQAIATRNFEPGGAYNLFKLRGTVTNRKNNIQIVPFVNQRIGGLQIEQAAVGGNVTYTAKFSGHTHDEHSPFANYNSKTLDPVTKGSALLGFTSYKFNISGTEVHPADAYDGEQGSGYPAPTGARDEYTYSLGGHAHSVSVVPIDDSRSTQQRLFDRFGNAYNTVTNGVSDAWKQATTHDPNLNRWGNGVDIARAAVAGVGSFADAGAEIIGANDMADGIAAIKGTASMNALQRLPYQAQLTAIESMLKADKAQQRASNAYQDWRAENPNWAVTADVAADIASRAVDRMGKGHHANHAHDRSGRQRTSGGRPAIDSDPYSPNSVNRRVAAGNATRAEYENSLPTSISGQPIRMPDGRIRRVDVDLQPTLDNIANNRPAYDRDGIPYRNENRALPTRNTYTEWTIPTDGVHDRGPQRIVQGSDGSLYYTPNHFGDRKDNSGRRPLGNTWRRLGQINNNNNGGNNND